LPTGLFQFEQIDLPDMQGTVPQSLYQGNLYLATGYGGQTARLPSGSYTVRYHSHDQTPLCTLVTDWWYASPIPRAKEPEDVMQQVFPPETNLNLRGSFNVAGQTYPWNPLETTLAMDLRAAMQSQTGVVYLTTKIVSSRDQEVGLVLAVRGGCRVWLNGEHLTGAQHSTSSNIRRYECFGRLQAGVNTLLVKVYVSGSGNWPFTMWQEFWNSYQVNVVTNAASQIVAREKVAATANALDPIAGVEGIVFCQVPNKPNGTSGLHREQFRIVRRPDQARIVSLRPATPAGVLTDLTSRHFSAAMHPRLSSDGRRLIFTARPRDTANSKWTIYDMTLDGDDVRQITDGTSNCYDPEYLPGGRVVFCDDRSGFRDEYDRDIPPLLFTCALDGSGLDQISFNLSSDTAPVVLHDGRILFTSWQHHADHRGTAGSFDFFTVLPDGMGFNPFALFQSGMSKTKSYAQELTDGRVVFVESTGHRHYNAGALGLVHARNPHKTYERITPDMVFNGANLAGRYASPYPLPDGGMLCAYSPGRVVSAYEQDPYEEPHEGIYTFDFAAGRPRRLLFDDPDAQDYGPVAIYARPEPPQIPSMVIRSRSTGTLTCVDAYLSDRSTTQKNVVVGSMPPALPGEIKAVRVIEGFGVLDKNPKKHKRTVIDMLQMTFGSNSNGGNSHEQKRILGVVPVEPDGSFSVEVPADTTLFLQTLDENHMAIENQLTWTWVRPGETRMCIGCHEARDTGLHNRDMQTLYTQTYFAAPPPEERYTVDFRRDIMPIIESKCSHCHNADDPAGGLDLRSGFELVFHRKGRSGRTINAACFNHAYESLLQAPGNRVGTLVIPGAARHSPLIWWLYGRQLAQTDARNPYKKQPGRMPPRGALSDVEKMLFVEWVDLGAQWDNIPSEDPLPGYDADHSARLAAEAEAELRMPIINSQQAFTVRCLECHDNRTLQKLDTYSDAEIPALVERMANKEKGWIFPDEILLITQILLAR
ncbi:MAG: HzsA-related protein, partial [Planctomycetota bacterium]